MIFTGVNSGEIYPCTFHIYQVNIKWHLRCSIRSNLPCIFQYIYQVNIKQHICGIFCRFYLVYYVYMSNSIWTEVCFFVFFLLRLYQRKYHVLITQTLHSSHKNVQNRIRTPNVLCVFFFRTHIWTQVWRRQYVFYTTGNTTQSGTKKKNETA